MLPYIAKKENIDIELLERNIARGLAVVLTNKNYFAFFENEMKSWTHNRCNSESGCQMKSKSRIKALLT